MSTKKTKSSPKQSKNTTKKSPIKQKSPILSAIESSSLLELHPTQVDENSNNPLLSELFKKSPEPVVETEQLEEPSSAAKTRVWGERINPKTGERESSRFSIQIMNIAMHVSKKYEKDQYRPTDDDFEEIKKLMKLKNGPLNEIIKAESVPKNGARLHDDLVFQILKHRSSKKNKPKIEINEDIDKPETNTIEFNIPENAQQEEDMDKAFLLKEEEFVPLPNAEEEEKFKEEVKENEKERLEKEDFIDVEQIYDDTKIPDLNIKLSDTSRDLQSKVGVMPTDINSKEYNAFLFNKEKLEYENNKNDDSYDFLYPELNDPNFNLKLAKKKEFHDTMFDGTIYTIEERANIVCDASFELLPHQLFVKNFLSLQTPYNSLLLYNGLGTGKTCSAIGIAEEMRAYMKQVGIVQKIIVVAFPNVQNNFRLQLFDERKLKKEGALWNLNTCIGNALLKEINPTNLQGLTRDKIVSQINIIINTYYEFLGYGELTNIIKKQTNVDMDSGYTAKEKKQIEIKKIRKYFDNRLIIIDEVHNIRLTQENKEGKKTAMLLMYVAKYAQNIRLLLLSATPMYNSYKEIIWLTNLMNIIDKRSTIEENMVFDKDGNFLEKRESKEGLELEGGKELLQRKLTGYVSYVRGENPYTFPYRIYPYTFSPNNVINLVTEVEIENKIKYPELQMNLKPIEKPLQHIPVYASDIGSYQKNVYAFIMNFMRNKSFNTVNALGQVREMPSFENMESFGYTHLKEPIESLNIVYPNNDFSYEAEVEPVQVGGADSKDDDSITNLDVSDKDAYMIKNMTGKTGLANVMNYKIMKSPYELRYDFQYKPEFLEQYGRMFSPENIGKYSGKIKQICDSIKKSKGIVIVYSQYIDGGVVPLALALEEMGFSRFGSASYTKSLFETPPVEPIDSVTMKSRTEFNEDPELKNKTFNSAKYVMITGTKFFSPNNLADIKYITNNDNKNGEKVKVILITKAAAEGLDFKNIRQVHILEPWYNMNRIEQIIGRAVRNLSHCQLPFVERNVEIYLHSTKPYNNEEPADLYVYRFAEKKSLLIGKVTRLLKEIAVDCLLNIGQTNFTVDKLLTKEKNTQVKLKLSSGLEVNYKIGDRPFTDICDYMDNCNFTCSPNQQINEEDLNKNTYNEEFSKMNYLSIVKRIRQLFREQSFYKRDNLYSAIQVLKTYPIEHIDFAVSSFIDNKNELLLDKYGRMGYLINASEFYAFQPIEVSDENISIFERTAPISFKQESLQMELPKEKDSIREPEIIQILKKDENKEDLVLEKVESKVTGYTEVLSYIREQVKIMNIERENAEKKKKMETGEMDWFKHLGRVFKLLIQIHDVPEKIIEKYAIYHCLDTIKLEDKLFLLNQLYKTDINLT
jgi:hypothetical protein